MKHLILTNMRKFGRNPPDHLHHSAHTPMDRLKEVEVSDDVFLKGRRVGLRNRPAFAPESDAANGPPRLFSLPRVGNSDYYIVRSCCETMVGCPKGCMNCSE